MSERRSAPTPSWEPDLEEIEEDWKDIGVNPEAATAALALIIAQQLRELLLLVRPLADHPLLRRFR